MVMGTEIFQRNIQAMRETFPSLADLLIAFEPQNRYLLLSHPELGWLAREEAGSVHASRTVDAIDLPIARGWRVKEATAGALFQHHHWIHGPERSFPPCDLWRMAGDGTDPELVIVYRCGLGYLTTHLFDRLNRLEAESPTDRRLLVLEDRLELIHAALTLFDWTTLIQSDRVFFAVHRNIPHIVAEFFERYPAAVMTSWAMVCGSLMDSRDLERMQQLESEIRHYEGKVQADFQRRFEAAMQERRRDSAQHVRRILFVVPGHNYLQQACVAALCEMTHYADHALEPAKIFRYTKHGVWLRQVEQYQPDLIVGVNATPYAYFDHPLLDKLGCLTAVWYVDNPARFHDRREDLERTDLVAGFDADYLPWLREHGAQAPFVLHTAAGLIGDVPVEKTEVSGCPLFVGELGVRGFEMEELLLQQTNPELFEKCQEVLDAFLADPRQSLETYYQQMGLSEYRPFRGYIVCYLENKATYFLRKRYLEPLADAQLAIFGPEEWGDPEKAGKLTDCWQGRRVLYGKELATLYRSAGVVLNVFHAQCLEGLNPRVYDGAACRGLLVTNRCSGLSKDYTPGRQLFAADGPEEFASLVRERLDSRAEIQDENRRIADEAYRKTLVKHRYHARMQILLFHADRILLRNRYGYIS